MESDPILLPARQSQNRACRECNRKKTRCEIRPSIREISAKPHEECDRRKPTCSLCDRIGQSCSYPIRRKRPAPPWPFSLSKEKTLKSVRGQDLGMMLERLYPQRSTAIQPEIRPQSSETTLDFPQEIGGEENWSPAGLGNLSQASSGSILQTDEAPDNQLSPDFDSWVIDTTFQNGDSSGEDSFGPMAFLDLLAQQSMPENFLFHSISPPASHESAQNFEMPTPTGRAVMLEAPLVNELIDIFFDKLSSFVLLLHRPSFKRQYRVHDTMDSSRYHNLDIEGALILNSMIALSARFSSSPYFSSTPPKERGRAFARTAEFIYEEAMKLDNPAKPTLQLLQGCILLAYYHQLCGAAAQSWVLVGTCCRLAYDLGLNNVDEDLLGVFHDAQWVSAEDWSQREERRRAWWLVWELDVFASTILRRPHAIDKTRINVLLPVSDAQWFSGVPLASDFLIPHTFKMWKTLRGSPNQEVRAWFLLSLILMATAYDLTQRHQTTTEEIEEFASTLKCFDLILPSQYHLSSSELAFDVTDFGSSNWIIEMALVMHTARMMLHQRSSPPSSNPDGTPAPEDPSKTQQHRQLVFKAINSWDPEYIAFACPLVSCTLIGPFGVNVEAAMAHERSTIYLDMLTLVLERIGTYWDIGSVALKLVQLLEARKTRGTMESDTSAERFPMLLPQTNG